MNTGINAINEAVQEAGAFVRPLFNELGKVIVGQAYLVERLVVGLLANGHVLLEGVPGLAKTLSVKCLADAIRLKFQRLQFTPDLLPADLIGTQIYNPQKAEFSVRKGPVFANIILADEINRAPAKVQSALLEAMQERQVTIGETTFKLDEPFLVLATQNPIEQEGTYPRPEAQIDRFMLMLKITYPSPAEERIIMDRMTGAALPTVTPVAKPADILHAREIVKQVYVDDKIKNYVLDLVIRTRQPGNNGLADLNTLIQFGASPRASINLILAARAHAFLQGRGFVTPEDIKQIAPDVLRHRIITTYEAEAENITSDHIVRRILDYTPVP